MRSARIIFGVGLVLAVGVAGYWAGRDGILLSNLMGAAQRAAPQAVSDSEPILYFRDPDGKLDYSETPKKTADGRDFIAVRASDEPGIATPKKAETAKLSPSVQKQILYYRNPMGLADISQAPKKDSMGMDYIPVYEGDDEEGPTIKIAAGKLQRTGVMSEPASLRVLQTRLRAPGVIQLDEHRQSVVALRFEAFIEKLEHVTTGSEVRAGEPLMRLYSPALSSAAAEYLSSLRLGDTTPGNKGYGSRQRLENLGIPDSIIKDIEKKREGQLTVTWPAPRDGIVTEHNVVEGMRTNTGDVLFRIADISVVWALADVAERDLSLIALGQTATVTPRGYPGKNFTGMISMIYPAINRETRTARIRIELANPNRALMPDMYVDADIATGSDKPVLTVPDNAVIDSGARKIVLLDRGEGRFQPREVKIGRRGGGYVEITSGLAEGDKAVTSANFLLDAESNLKAALQSLSVRGERQ
jgi:Cu(I)/Ag(I) efflux system membrane fusion protein